MSGTPEGLLPKMRCLGCRMMPGLCVCHVVPKSDTRSRVVVVMHQVESVRNTNSGRLVPVALRKGEIRLWGLRDREFDDSGLCDPDRRTLVLFPSAGAEVLTRNFVVRDTRPVTLVVPDGTWNHARRIPQRIAAIKNAERVRLPFAGESTYQLREESSPDRLATFEAITRAMGILEGPVVQERMETLFRVMVDRLLYLSGRKQREDVFGGIPLPPGKKARRRLEAKGILEAGGGSQ